MTEKNGSKVPEGKPGDESWKEIKPLGPLFPIVVNKCPYCGSKEPGIVRREADIEVKAGHLAADVKVGFVVQVHITDNRKSAIVGQRYPVIIGRFDVCSKCFGLMPVEIDHGKATVFAKPGAYPGFPG